MYSKERTVPVSQESEAAPRNHGLRRHSIVESLMTDVFQGRLRPGEHLVTQELAERFGVSHTPIREALIALAGIGLIDLMPNRGAIVRRVTSQEVREVCQVRRVLECEAVRSACGRIDLPALHALAADFKRLLSALAKSKVCNVEESRELDTRLHDLIAGSCNNTFLANELGRLKTLFRGFRDFMYLRHESRNDFHRLVEETRDHLAIVEALLAGERREAVRAMARHIRSAVRYWSRAIVVAPNAAETSDPRNGASRNGNVKRRRRA
jgi:DNA-binding GntR family transcriptional regulator